LENTDVTVETILKLVYEPLLVLDDTMRPVANPALLSSIEMAADGASALLTIQPSAVWTDGTPVTAQDVTYSVEVLRNAPEDAVHKACVSNIASVEIVGEKAARLHFAQAAGYMPYMLMFPLVPAHTTAVVGNGLYVVAEYAAPEALVLTASETVVKRAYIDTISVKITPDRESDMSAFDQRLIDAAAPGIADWARYRGQTGVQTAEYVTNYFEFVGFNFERDTVQNVEIRRLAATAVTTEAFLNSLYIDNAMRAQTPVSPASWLHERGMPDAVADEAAARAALTGLGLTILVNEENAERVKIAEALGVALSAAGAMPVVVSLPFDAYSERLLAGDFDMFVGGYNLSLLPDLSFMFHSQAIGSTNLLRYQDARMDELLTNVFQATSDLNLRRAMGDLQKYIARELPCVGLVFRKSAVVTGAGVEAVGVPVANNPYAGIGEWFVVSGR